MACGVCFLVLESGANLQCVVCGVWKHQNHVIDITFESGYIFSYTHVYALAVSGVESHALAVS